MKVYLLLLCFFPLSALACPGCYGWGLPGWGAPGSGANPDSVQLRRWRPARPLPRYAPLPVDRSEKPKKETVEPLPPAIESSPQPAPQAAPRPEGDL